jgi:hypothetical protein
MGKRSDEGVFVQRDESCVKNRRVGVELKKEDLTSECVAGVIPN